MKLRSFRRPRGGFTIIECVIAMAMVLLAVQVISMVIVTTTKTRKSSTQRILAARSARSMLEQLHAEDFFDLYALYNSDPADDPDGPGTGPGPWFEVPGLQPRDQAPAAGRIFFPVVLQEGTEDTFVLREDRVDRKLGMPRDLNGDHEIDTADRSGDYILLPLRVEVSWGSAADGGSYVIHTMIAELRS